MIEKSVEKMLQKIYHEFTKPQLTDDMNLSEFKNEREHSFGQ